jgi:hypothetical protein
MSWFASIAFVLLVWFFLFEVLLNFDEIEELMEEHPKLARMFDWIVSHFLTFCVVVMLLSFFGFWVIITKWMVFGR